MAWTGRLSKTSRHDEADDTATTWRRDHRQTTASSNLSFIYDDARQNSVFLRMRVCLHVCVRVVAPPPLFRNKCDDNKFGGKLRLRGCINCSRTRRTPPPCSIRQLSGARVKQLISNSLTFYSTDTTEYTTGDCLVWSSWYVQCVCSVLLCAAVGHC